MKNRQRLDEVARNQGWTHRIKGKSRDPYVKLTDRSSRIALATPELTGATFIDMDQKFRFIRFAGLVEL